MADELFIRQVAALVQRFGPQYGILVNSPVIAQAILESGSKGNSELAINAHNYIGIKYKLKADGSKRCPTALDEPYIKIGSEQDKSGNSTTYEMQWFRFPNMESAIKGYYDFINVSRYANLKGVKSPDEYCRLIEEDSYATDIDYADKLIRIIKNYNLIQYDNLQNEEKIMLKLALGSGHGLNSANGCWTSIDPNGTKEWLMGDRICDRVEEILAEYDGVSIVRLDDTTGKVNVPLAERKARAEAFGADIYISVHHNAGVKGGAGGGTQVYHYNKPENKVQAQRLYDAVVAQTKLVGNRAEKVVNGNHLYECREPIMNSYILENGFMDSTTDVPIIITQAHAEKTAQGIVNFLVSEFGLTKKQITPPNNLFIPVTDFAYEEPVIIKQDTITALASQYGKTAEELLNSNPGIYKIGTDTYIVNKNTVIYVG